ncbi:T9SS type A sorting domain-containing protein [Aestuariivivens sediminicola]|uniref:T9SS type A sorting domain-containing protein n=1 Tax=Aestuariivivens sediminicola TaxID=2913560 RepID=UPI001F55D621|nr:T9SS type A sorting domain-containing protein [Aestuariivivens sediminicola]
MKKITLFLLSLMAFAYSFAQKNISVDNPDGTGWNPYVNAFNTSDDSFAFGFSYDMSKQKTEFDGLTVTVKPNYGIWVDEANNAAWFDNPGVPPSNPNKNIEALSYLQVDRPGNPDFFNQDVVFSGNVNAFTIDGSYVVKAFIAVFPNDFSSSVRYETTITEAGPFTLTRPVGEVDAAFTEQFFQYGFIVYGLPADPAQEATLGSVVFQNPALSVDDKDMSKFSFYPNPTQDSWNIKSQDRTIRSIQVFDVLGKNVISVKPNKSETTINGNSLLPGMYFAKIYTDAGSSSMKLIKQ